MNHEFSCVSSFQKNWWTGYHFCQVYKHFIAFNIIIIKHHLPLLLHWLLGANLLLSRWRSLKYNFEIEIKVSFKYHPDFTFSSRFIAVGLPSASSNWTYLISIEAKTLPFCSFLLCKISIFNYFQKNCFLTL